MSFLFAYNLTGAPVSLAAGNNPLTLPASTAPPARGEPSNATSELRGLSNPDYLLLEAQVVAGDIALEWSGTPDYATPGLSVVLNVTSGTSGRVVYRPGATGADAPGGAVFTDWAKLDAAVLTPEQKALGKLEIEFDPRFSLETNAVLGVPVCLIEGVVSDMTNVSIHHHLAGAGHPGSFQHVFIEFRDGGVFDHLLEIDGPSLFIIGNNTVETSIPLYEFEQLVVNGWRNQMFSTLVNAVPLFDVVGTFATIVLNGNSNNFGEVAVGNVSLTEILDLPAGKTMRWVVQEGLIVPDTVRGDGVFFYLFQSDTAQFREFDIINANFTGTVDSSTCIIR